MIAFLMLACSGEPTVAPPPAQDPTAAPAPPVAIPVDARAAARVLAPSPREMEAAVRKAGIADALGPLIPERTYKMDSTEANIVAVRTGVVLADAILTPVSAPKPQFVARLEMLRDGMKSVGMGAGLVASMDDMLTRVKNDAASRDDFVSEVDSVAAQMVPEGGWGPADKSGPLVQAGAWLEGANLVSTAIIAANKPEAAATLLQQKEVPDYFLKYIESDAPQGADRAVLTQLKLALTDLRDLSNKPVLAMEDVQRVKSDCDLLLTLL